jgi:hypothetical protein
MSTSTGLTIDEKMFHSSSSNIDVRVRNEALQISSAHVIVGMADHNSNWRVTSFEHSSYSMNWYH